MVSPVGTYPLDQGSRVRVAQLVHALVAAGHEVDFLYNPGPIDGPADVGRMQTELGERLHVHRPAWADARTIVPRRGSRLRRTLGRWKRAARGWRGYVPAGIDQWYDPGLDAVVRDLHARRRYQAVLVEYAILSRALLNFGPDVLKVIDTHDAFSLRTRQLARRGQGALAMLPLTRRAERTGLQRADAVIAIEATEADYLRRLAGRPVTLLGHITPILETPPPPSDRVFFTGGSADLNVDGLNWFLTEVWPVVRRDCRAAQLVVAGKVCDRLGPAPEGVRLDGFVPDLAGHYASASVVINPVRYGSGQAIKAIEALGAGRPLVATTAGSRGIEPSEATGCVVADSPPAFAAAITRLLADPDRRAALGDRARAYATACNRRLVDRLTNIFAAPAEPSAARVPVRAMS